MVNEMKIAAMTFRLHAPWVHSLKEKRMIVKSLIAKLQNKFHVSAAEIDEQDTHQIIVIGIAAIVPHNAIPAKQSGSSKSEGSNFRRST